MFYLEKCAECDRSGSVALEENDKVCNLCKVKKPEKKEEKEVEEE